MKQPKQQTTQQTTQQTKPYRKIIRNAKQLSVYFSAFVICLLIMNQTRMKFGSVFISAFIIAPIVSYVMLKCSKISVKLQLSSHEAHKGETFSLTTSVENKGILPTPFLVALFNDGWRLGENKVEPAVFIVSRGRSNLQTRNCQAAFWGSFSFGISAITMVDYLGLFILKDAGQALFEKVSIYPEINIPRENDLAVVVGNRLLEDDKEDQTSDKPSLMSQPGYEFRPYLPGDPLNRVNQKILAMRDLYMIRKDEFLKTRNVSILLDPRGSNYDEGAIIYEERTVEGVLAMLTSLVKENVDSKVSYYSDGQWQTIVVDNADKIITLQSIFLTYTFSKVHVGARIPAQWYLDEGVSMLFTCALDSELCQEISALPCNELIVVYPEELPCDVVIGNMWKVNNTYDFCIR